MVDHECNMVLKSITKTSIVAEAGDSYLECVDCERTQPYPEEFEPGTILCPLCRGALSIKGVCRDCDWQLNTEVD